VRLLGSDILLRMARTHRDVREVQPRQQLAHRAFVQLHAELPSDLVAQVDAAPANDLVLRCRPPAHPLRHRRLLLKRQLARRPAALGCIVQTRKPALIVAMHPIAQRLPIHACSACRFAPPVAFHHQGKREHPTRRRCVLTTPRRRTKTGCIQLRPCDRHRHRRLLVMREGESDRAAPAQLTFESTHPAVGIIPAALCDDRFCPGTRGD
jgi:hypothetical protein